MTVSITYGDGNCPECGRGPVSFGIPIYRRPSRAGGLGHEVEIWCLECARNKLLHSDKTGRE